MNRRSVLSILGCFTGSLATVTATGAFNSSRINRNAQLNIANDASGVLGLRGNDRVSGVREKNDELTIDLTGTGININSTYQFGAFAEDPSVDPTPEDLELITVDQPSNTEGGFDSAFVVQNRSGESQYIKIELARSSSDTSDMDTIFLFQIHNEGNPRGYISYPGEVSPYVTELTPGTAIGVSFVVNANNGHKNEEFNADIKIKAGDHLG